MAAVTTSRPIVPKSMPPAPFDRQAVLAKLFALPLPPYPYRGKHYPITTPLGYIMRLRVMTVNQLSAQPDVPCYRVLSDYLAERKPIPAHHRGAIARALGVDPRIL